MCALLERECPILDSRSPFVSRPSKQFCSLSTDTIKLGGDGCRFGVCFNVWTDPNLSRISKHNEFIIHPNWHQHLEVEMRRGKRPSRALRATDQCGIRVWSDAKLDVFLRTS